MDRATSRWVMLALVVASVRLGAAVTFESGGKSEEFKDQGQPAARINEETYANPVIPGEFPDPSIIRVGETYYAAGTSCDFAPQYPLYESSDLINWQQMGAVFSEPPTWASDDFWAPELFYNDGTFYVYYTAKRKDNHVACIGVATTRDIHKGFTDHGILIEWGEEAIDAFVFKDDDGTLYITWKAYGLTQGRRVEILASEVSADGLRLVGDAFTLTDHARGWQGFGDEGQCLVKHDGWYYLLYSIGGCCDNRCDYRVRVARSRNLKTGWEQYPDPILQGGKQWRCPGHGTLVTTPDGRFFYLYHSYNARDFEFIGRQGMLDEVLWNPQTGWPYFKNGDTPSVQARLPFHGTEQSNESLWIDDFSSDKSLSLWEWDIHHPKPSIEISEGELCLTTSHDGISFIGLRPQTGDYSLEAEVIPAEGLAGIGVFSDHQNLLALMVNQTGLLLYRVNNGTPETLSKQSVQGEQSVFLRCDVLRGRYFKFDWSANAVDWLPVEVPGADPHLDATFIAQWGYSPRAGFMVQSDGPAAFRFSNLAIRYAR